MADDALALGVADDDCDELVLAFVDPLELTACEVDPVADDEAVVDDDDEAAAASPLAAAAAAPPEELPPELAPDWLSVAIFCWLVLRFLFVLYNYVHAR